MTLRRTYRNAWYICRLFTFNKWHMDSESHPRSNFSQSENQIFHSFIRLCWGVNKRLKDSIRRSDNDCKRREEYVLTIMGVVTVTALLSLSCLASLGVRTAVFRTLWISNTRATIKHIKTVNIKAVCPDYLRLSWLTICVIRMWSHDIMLAARMFLNVPGSRIFCLNLLTRQFWTMRLFV